MIKQIILEYENFTYLNRLSKLVGVPPNPISDKSLRGNNRRKKIVKITDEILDENLRRKF